MIILSVALINTVFGSIFWVMFFLILAASLIAIFVESRKKDRALKTFHKYHSVAAMLDGSTIWGTIKVFSRGLEFVYDEPYKGSSGLVKGSYLLYNPDIENVFIFTRLKPNLDDKKKRKRYCQIKKLGHNGIFIRIWRWISSYVKRLKDAIRKLTMLIVGEIYKTQKVKSYSRSRTQAERIGSEVVNVIDDNLYEQMLEQYIGKQVIVKIICPAADNAEIELKGYLYEYSDKFISIINIGHRLKKIGVIDIEKEVDDEEYAVRASGDKVLIINRSPIPLVVENISDKGLATKVILVKGCHIKFKKIKDKQIVLYRTTKFDFIVPRKLAKVRHIALIE